MIFEYSSYRGYLKGVLAQKIARNPAFSLRAMARQLHVSPSLLCEVYQGKKNLSMDRANNVARMLSLKNDEMDYFCALVELEHSTSEEAKKNVIGRLQRMRPRKDRYKLEPDTLLDLGEWFYIPLLAMFDLAAFQPVPRNIARKLGISEFEAVRGLSGLLRVGLLKRDGQGKIRRAFDTALFESKGFHTGLRTFHRQMLVKAMTALDDQAPADRVNLSETLAIDPVHLPRVEAALKLALATVVEECSAAENKTQVYHFTFNAFRLTSGGTKRAG